MIIHASHSKQSVSKCRRVFFSVSMTIIAIVTLIMLYSISNHHPPNTVHITNNNNKDELNPINLLQSAKLLIKESPQGYNISKQNIFSEYILFLRMFHGKRQIFDDIFFDTLKFFWPFHIIPANLIIVLDDESPQDHQFEKYLIRKFQTELSSQITNNGFKFYITYEKPNPKVYNGWGHNRQQWSMFWCDKFLKKLGIYNQYKYVGFVDTDTMFTSVVTPTSIFKDPNNLNNPKPIKIEYLGFGGDHTIWKQCGFNTKQWFGKTELFRDMTQFPATYKISHIEDFRKKTVQHWKRRHFDEIVPILTANHGVFSQFSLFSTYAWYYAQNEYEWYFEPAANNQWETRKEMYNIYGTDQQILNLSQSNVHDGTKESMIRIAEHSRYSEMTKGQAMRLGMIYAHCYSISWDDDYCKGKKRRKEDIYSGLYGFEARTYPTIWTQLKFQQQSIDAQNNYFEDVTKLISLPQWKLHPLYQRLQTVLDHASILRNS